MRRLHGGVSPDLEVSRHLREVGYQAGAPLLGSLSWRRRGRGRSEPDTVALAYRFVPNEGDSWAHMLDQLDFFYEDMLSGDTALPPPVAAGAGAGVLDLAGPPDGLMSTAGPELALLGHRTAELHLALATGDDPAFAPERFNALYQRSLYQGLRTQLRTTLGMLRRRVNGLSESTAVEAKAVLAGQDALLGRLEVLRVGRIDAVRTRTHGDYHLGQVLYTGRDFVIIDFEGEPARAISERRIKHTPLRDVAGMFRSFDYAAQVALSLRRERGLIADTDEPLAQAWAAWWPRAASAAFLGGYLTTEGIANLLPAEHDDIAVLLDVLVLEKALYELRYELDNRPDWAWLPLNVLAAATA
jgi:maltose alpha-D-glucosyltransferase / alpha-amylase